jgi:hypothetical protein
VSEGEQHLKNISDHTDADEQMPPKAKDAVEKDLQNLKSVSGAFAE